MTVHHSLLELHVYELKATTSDVMLEKYPPPVGSFLYYKQPAAVRNSSNYYP